MSEWIKLTATDGFEFNAYCARPAEAPRGGVVVIHEVWGVNSWVRSVVDRYAAQGYLAVAPAMFDRVSYGYESENYGADQFVVIREMMTSFDLGTAMLDVAAAVSAAAEGGKVGITGFCFGGRVTWRAAHQGLGIAAGSGYYGGGVPGYIDLAPAIPLEMHYGDRDKGIPLEQIEALKERYPEVGIYLYSADHGFCNSDRPANFNAEACRLATSRSLAFFRQHLG
jgi:carboxymethylenebutenolidase